MSHVSTVGMMLYLILAIFGGFLTGLFSRYVFSGCIQAHGKIIAILFTSVFYVAPLWSIVSLFKDDDLDIFYILLIISFCLGLVYFNRFPAQASSSDIEHYMPDDD